jgi:hypothetical protein
MIDSLGVYSFRLHCGGGYAGKVCGGQHHEHQAMDRNGWPFEPSESCPRKVTYAG